MAFRADLHLHTTASDGVLTPSQMVHLAAQRGLQVIAITDHDSTQGMDEALEAAQAFPGLKVIPGVEVNTDSPSGEVHILGYFIQHRNPEFQEALRRRRESRVERARRMCQRLGDMGMPLPWERVVAATRGGTLGRPHIAQAMLEQGYISSLKEAFQKYIGFGGPAYVEREKAPPEEAVKLILQARGVPVLAHPRGIGDLESLAARLKTVGLAGLEAYCPGYRAGETAQLEALARQLGLIPLGGSDHHGLPSLYGGEVGSIHIPRRSLGRLLALEPVAI